MDRKEAHKRKTKETMEGMGDISCFNDLTYDEAISINSIFFTADLYPTFSSNEEFEAFIRHRADDILKVRELIDNNHNDINIFDKGLVLACFYLYPNDKYFKYQNLNEDKQRKFIKILATSSPEERKIIETISKEYSVNICYIQEYIKSGIRKAQQSQK